MPTYDYLCDDCGQEFEAFHSMRDDPLSECRICGQAGKVRRKIGTGAGIIFKGSGFYETDFKDRKGKPTDSTPGTTATSSSGEGGEKSGKSDSAKASPSTSGASSE